MMYIVFLYQWGCSWSLSYGSCTYNNLCCQYLSQL